MLLGHRCFLLQLDLAVEQLALLALPDVYSESDAFSY